MTRASAHSPALSADERQVKKTAITVAICTYNGAERLPAVLDRLQHQDSVGHLLWEIIVVDNNSTDATADVVRTYQRHWTQQRCPLRYCFEAQQGIAFARHAAVLAARASLVGFLDDDNLPAANWVAAACAFGASHPRVGAYGSRVDGQFEAPLPRNFERILPFFAITQRGSIPHRYEHRQRVLPPAAGLVVRRQTWLDHVPKQLILLGAARQQRLAGEDLEAMSYIQQAKWEIWHNPEMVILHQIPRWRLDRAYLMDFFKSIGLSRHVTRMLRLKPWQRPFLFVLYWLNDARKALRHLLIYRQKLKTETVAACELQLYVNSLVSPFYIWWLLWSRRR
ncbi:MAG: glycosyltransferase family 2 protein [Leptolyngbya sp. SIO4C1]|nr:glycosyltransferase family 2 protein [Leptolyngbya sp. SIO4C1]